MSRPKTASYGSWKSPIGARQIAESTIRLGEIMVAGGAIYWNEQRPTEGGRCVVVRRSPDGRITDMVPEGFNARTRVHEYGGGAYLPLGDGVVFANFADQRLYSCDGKGEPEAITPQKQMRYADFVLDEARGRLIAVLEDHAASDEAVNTIAAVGLNNGDSEVLVGGNDFYADPRLGPGGMQLAWLTWNHPDMPWDAAELWVAPVCADGSLGRAVRVAGGEGESICQPQWSPDGVLYFISDRTDWWNIYRFRDGRVEPMTQLEAEFAGAHWIFRQSYYAFDGPEGIICSYARAGTSHLAVLNLATRTLAAVDTPYTGIGSLRVTGGQVAFIGASPSRPTAVVLMALATGDTQELRRASDLTIDPDYISIPQALEFPTEGRLTAHALFYVPRNRDFSAPGDEKPPLVVMAHGGPTAATSTALRLGIQYYTSRGIAVLDVNYRGSTGYGRKYRERLYGQWGVVDVDDCCNGAKHLADRGLVDAARMAITGRSAGGYTTLACLAFRDVFAAGASHFGVSDCEALARETHKFESSYLDRLIGPYPQRRDLYIERSPIHHADGLSCPVLFFQGAEDRIVPPNQARMMADVVRKKHLPVAYLEFEGEQHGFRRAENIRRVLEGELYFLSRIFGFEPADDLEPIEIENL